MSFRRTVKRVDADDPITAEDRNYIAAEIERCVVVPGPGIFVEWGPFGQTVSAAESFSDIRMVLTQSAGIPYATTATVGTVVTLTPGSALCWDSTLNSNESWSTDTSVTAGLTVYNDFTSSSSTNAGVGSMWVMVGTAPDGTTRLIGDPC